MWEIQMNKFDQSRSNAVVDLFHLRGTLYASGEGVKSAPLHSQWFAMLNRKAGNQS